MKLVGFRITEKKQRTDSISATQQRRSSQVYPPQRRKRRKRRTNWFSVIAGILILGVLIAAAFALRHMVSQQDSDAGLQFVGDIPIYEDFLPEGYAARQGGKRKILYIVMHETDNINSGANAQAHNTFIHNNGKTNELSWHYTVDDHEIWHHVPDDETAFHAGDHMVDRGGNKNGVGVEMCVNEDGNYEQTLKNAQKLAAMLLYEYDLSIDDLKKHQDFSGKLCPSKLIHAGRWEEFKQGVEAEWKQILQQEKTKSEK